MRIVAVVSIILLIVLRFVNLTKIPIFIDEQTYLKLGDIAVNDKDGLFLSVKYLVFPVVPWILGISQLLFASFLNVLFLGRSVMVIADLVSALFIYLIGKKILSPKYAIICIIIYLIIPLNFFHSRIILLEPITNMFFLAGLYFYLGIFERNTQVEIRKSISKILTAGVLFLLSFLSKPLALVSFSALPMIAIFFWINDQKRNTKKLLFYLCILLFIFTFVLLLSLPLIFSVWQGFSDYRISPDAHQMHVNFKKNLWLVWWWSKTYISPAIIFAVFISFIYAVFIKEWKVLWIIFWLFVVIFLESLIGTNFLPRHLFLISAPIAMAVGFLFVKILDRFGNVITFLLMTLLFLIPLKVDAQIVLNPKNAPIALEDKQQFFEDWTSGIGLDRVASQLKNISSEKEIFIYVESDGGFGWALAHLYDTGNSTILESNQLNDRKSMLYLPKKDNIYVVLNREPDLSQDWPLELVGAYPKQTERRYIKIYKYQ